MRILLVGDVMLGRLVNEALEHERPEYVWGDTLDIFGSADWRACNLECAISDRGWPWDETPKTFHFRTDAKNIECLLIAGIDCVSLANNHVLDYGYEAFEDTLKILDEARIAHAGAAHNSARAQQPAITEVDGIRIGFLAFTDNMPVWEAKTGTGGIFFAPTRLGDARTQHLLSLVEEARASVDYLIVSAHWGPNWGYEPPVEQAILGRALIDSGANLVHGHSAHICRGIELYRGCPILYSTGDFIDDYAVDKRERNDRSFIFCVEVETGSTERIELFPTVIRDFQARKAVGAEREIVVETMRELCAVQGTNALWRPERGCLHIPVGAGASSRMMDE